MLRNVRTKRHFLGEQFVTKIGTRDTKRETSNVIAAPMLGCNGLSSFCHSVYLPYSVPPLSQRPKFN